MLLRALFMALVVERVKVVVEVMTMMERQGGTDGDGGSNRSHIGGGASLRLRAKGDTDPTAQGPHHGTSPSVPSRHSSGLGA